MWTYLQNNADRKKPDKKNRYNGIPFTKFKMRKIKMLCLGTHAQMVKL